MIAVVNKTDLMEESSISRDDIESRLGTNFETVHFVSAKRNEGIDELFLDVATRAVAVAEAEAIAVDSGEDLEKKDPESGCC
jgi:50S ribosomal subunit-associated GTPase HflX